MSIVNKYFEQGGLVIGMDKDEKKKESLYVITKDTHSLCIGATRSGKSRSVVLQSICSLGLSDENLVISDPKGELFNYTEPFLKELGYTVLPIDFKNPLKSKSYNFLQTIIDAVEDNNLAEAVERAWDLTSALVGEAKGEKIWTNGEASTIAGTILNVVYDNSLEEKNKKYRNMTNVYHFLANMYKSDNSGNMLITDYMKKYTLKIDNHPSKGLIAISEIAPSRTRGSFFTAALTTLRLFTSPKIYSMTKESDFKLEDIGNKKLALFIILPDEKTTYYSLAALLVSQIYEELVNIADKRGGRLNRRVNFILDEFGNFTKIPDFPTKLTVGGGRGIRFNLFLQSFAQLDEKYGKEQSRIIRGNCDNWIYLKSNEVEDLEEISKKLDNYTVSTYSLSSSTSKNSAGSSSQSINLTGRRLLMPSEIKKIERPYSLVMSDGNPGIFYAPDISKYNFNTMLGMGDVEHNTKLREIRERKRYEKKLLDNIELNKVWEEIEEIFK